MRNTEIIKAAYDRLPDFRKHEYTLEQCFDRCLDVMEMIERERPELIKDAHHQQQDVGIDY